MMNKIPTPEEFFGFKPGSDRKMIRWEKLLEYYYSLEKLSDRIKIVEMGPSSEGNPFIMMFVSEKENLENLEYYREISLKMADPRGLTDAEIDDLASKGKAVCMQNYGLHSNEVGGPQMVPLMVYDLITAESGRLKRILDNVIFIICPCAEPDGEIIFTDWFYKYLGTEYEGVVSPYLRHNWAGHSNNRDAIRECVIESVYLNDFLIRNWKPQAYQDHHHSWPWEERMYLAPKSDPIYDHYSPIIQRETFLYGAKMAQDLSLAGRRGITLGHPDFAFAPITAFYNNAQLHNIAGMLTENADCNIASPIYISPERVKGVRKPEMICPDPWEGGEWHLYDIVDQMYLASLSLLDELAADPKAVLKRMAIKALGQTERGEKSEKQAYIIPKDQHDPSALREILLMMKAQCIDFYSAKEDFSIGSAKYEKGTIIVPLSQPNYAIVEMMFGKNPYPYAKRDVNPDGSIKVADTANLSVALCMGIEVLPAMEKLEVELCECVIPEENNKFPLSAKSNASYRAVNDAFKSGKKVFRDENGNFYLEGGEGRREIKALRTGLLKKSATWNEEEGYTRNILKNYNFDFDIVMDKEIRENGVPEEFDVIIIPGDNVHELLSGDLPHPTRPIEHKSGLGTGGAEALKKFVKKGGRLIVWERSCKYAVDLFALELTDLSQGLSKAQFMTAGSQLAARIEKDPITLGMPKEFTLTHNDGPVYKITGIKHEVETVVRLKETSDVYVNGLVKGEELLGGTPAIMRARIGEGELILYTFNPEYRFQQNGTYKLLFNALYE